jgi:hypothetical protein
VVNFLEPTGSGGVPGTVRRRLSTLDDWLDPYSWLVTVFVVGVAAILLDRDAYRRRWLRALENGYEPVRKPIRAMPWWPLVAGITVGLAVPVMWSALFFTHRFSPCWGWCGRSVPAGPPGCAGRSSTASPATSVTCC